MVRFLLLTGMRRGEAAKLEWKHYDGAQRAVEITAANTKTNRARTVPLTDEAHDLLLDQNRFTGGRIFKRPDGGAWADDHIRVRLAQTRKTLGPERARKLLPRNHGWHVTRGSSR